MQVDGRCHCGAIRFEAEVDPERVGICHCSDCQTFSGSAFRTSTFVREADLRLRRGEPAIYRKTAESGAARDLAFCARCGTHVWGVPGGGDGPRFYSVRVGVLAQRAALPPRIQLWCRSAMPWLEELSTVPRRERQSR